jgi:hypothetical protein
MYQAQVDQAVKAAQEQLYKVVQVVQQFPLVLVAVAVAVILSVQVEMVKQV